MKSKNEMRKAAAKYLVLVTIAMILCIYTLSFLFPQPGTYTSKGAVILFGIVWVIINIGKFYQLFTGKNIRELL
jgi:NADH:ubiquinone oxidoreductase subunit 2 (subunit N)